MKVLLIGGGGREHALAWKLVRESPEVEIVAAPGNPGIATLGRCVAVSATDVDALVALAEAERPAFTLVGPEAPLALGIVDRFRARGLPIFGPTQAAARIETSKAFAKQLMLDAGVPTARATRHTDPADAKRAAHVLGAPVVVKASGLAAGKGVIVAQTLGEAEAAIDDMLVGHAFGAAGAEVLVEEFMQGEELSVFYLTDGYTALPLLPLQDHKRLLAGDAGPNTGGMGAYAPVTIAMAQVMGACAIDAIGAQAAAPAPPDAVAPVPAEDAARLRDASGGIAVAMMAMHSIVAPTLAALRAAGAPFTGLLYAGLMLTDDGLRVVEFNCRFGDPETEALMPLLDLNAFPLGMFMHWIAAGGRLPDPMAGHSITMSGTIVLTVRTDPDAPLEPRTVTPASVTTVLAAAGYPEKPRTGDVVTLPETLPDGVEIFHAGTARDAAGRLVTAGGRVLAVTAVADDFATAQARSRAVAESVEFEGKQFRADIGWREAARRSEAATSS